MALELVHFTTDPAPEHAGNLHPAQTVFAFITEPPVMMHGTLTGEYLAPQN
jgi:hypothetical protein